MLLFNFSSAPTGYEISLDINIPPGSPGEKLCRQFDVPDDDNLDAERKVFISLKSNSKDLIVAFGKATAEIVDDDSKLYEGYVP